MITEEFREVNCQLTIWVDRELRQEFRDVCQKTGHNASDLLRQAMVKIINNPPAKKRLGVER